MATKKKKEEAPEPLDVPEEKKEARLTLDQEEFIMQHHKTIRDISELTQACFKNKELDGRCLEGRLVRAFLVRNNIDFKTSRHTKVGAIELTESQKHFIMQSAEQGMNSYVIAQLVFPDREVKKLSQEQRVVLQHIRSVNEDFVPSSESGLLTNYSPPKTYVRLIKRVYDAAGFEIEEAKMNRQHRSCLDKLAINLSNSRFVKIMNNYTSRDDRTLFEEEFVRLTWDKPDLSADELNLYMNVCKEIINLEVVSKHMNKLNQAFDEAEEQSEMTIRLAEMVKTKSAEYHQCEGRIETLTKKLQGDRSDRMKNKLKDNGSILALIQAFQHEEDRRNMINIAEMQKLAVAEEAEKLEGMAEFKARILGISKEDVI